MYSTQLNSTLRRGAFQHRQDRPLAAGFAGDRLEPAVELVEQADLDVLVFELLAERTIALAQRRKQSHSGPGYDERLLWRLRGVLPQAIAQTWPPRSSCRTLLISSSAR